MSSLADTIDRLSSTVKSIRNTSTSLLASSSSSSAGPFTRAVLIKPLGDLIRDADASELGLFTLFTPSPATAQEKTHEELTRVELRGATPLRRPAAARRDDATRVKEFEPEVYAQAALKYLDRYQSIRPMPRARSQVVTIIEQLATTRASLQSSNEVLAAKAASSNLPVSPKSSADAEERRIQELQAKITQLKKRKDAVAKTKRPVKPSIRKQPTSSPSTSLLKAGDSSQSSEDVFWQTPVASARVMHFTDTMLLHEEPDLADVSIGDMSVLSSLASPLRSESEPASADHSFEVDMGRDDYFEVETETEAEAESGNDSFDAEDDLLDEDDGDKTIMVKKAEPILSIPPEPVPSPTPPVVEIVAATPSRRTPSKLRVTNEVERISTKIWSTVGEIIMPGHSFDVSPTSSNKPPRAKETLAHIQHVASQTPSLSSPSAASLSSHSLSSTATNPSSGQPTTQQILTAHLLLTLLSSPPNYSMSHKQLKEVLASKIGGLTPQTAGKPVYACVAKKLLKFERGAGEQVVKFDV